MVVDGAGAHYPHHLRRRRLPASRPASPVRACTDQRRPHPGACPQFRRGRDEPSSPPNPMAAAAERGGVTIGGGASVPSRIQRGGNRGSQGRLDALNTAMAVQVRAKEAGGLSMWCVWWWVLGGGWGSRGGGACPEDMT
jgi:hypothetical protein